VKDYSEKELIKRCIKGKPDAQRMVYDKYAGLVYSICYRYAKNAEDAKDLLQETFINVFQHLKGFKAEGSFEGWIRRIAVNCSVRHYQISVKRIDDGDIESSVDPSTYSDVIDELSAEELMKIINQLPDGYRMVFNMYAIEGYSHNEIGEILGISPSASRSQLSRARQLLVEQIGSPVLYQKHG
jgi:RNA polymerase sigma-70 factor (ECF subfamily)